MSVYSWTMRVSSALLMVVLCLPKASLSIEILASNEVCWSAADRTHVLSYSFTAPYDGVIDGVRLVHLSGGGTCDTDEDVTNWGCRVTSDGLDVNLVELTDVVTGEGETMYPTHDTNGATILETFSECDCSARRYTVTGYGYNSDELVLASDTTTYLVSTQTEYALQYCEAACRISMHNNDGVSCAAVYFSYQEIFGTTEELASDEVCYDAGDSTHVLDYSFTAPYDGIINGVRLVHLSGGGTCSSHHGVTNWGCRVTPDRLEVNLVELTDDTTGEGTTMYPTDDTDGATIDGTFSSCNCSPHSYTVNGFGYDEDELVLLSTQGSSTSTYQVSTQTEYVLQYCQAACQISHSDSSGVSCAKVYFLYQEILTTHIPTPRPTGKPTKRPTTH